jgi:hypothetical protein
MAKLLIFLAGVAVGSGGVVLFLWWVLSDTDDEGRPARKGK